MRVPVSERSAAARAPGRLDVMGGIADYSGALVLQLPLAIGTTASIEFNDERTYAITSRTRDGLREFSVDREAISPELASYARAGAYFAADREHQWVSYVLGCLTVLHNEEGIDLPNGLTIEINSEVPEGKGVSSSAALEVSVMGALTRLLDLGLDGERIAILCQMVENRVAGAPCGIMDQMTAACGKKDHLLRLLCQPAVLQGHAALPNGLAIWGIDSGIRHSVGGADYGTVRTAAAMGYRMIASFEGFEAERISRGRVTINDPSFGGYLANIKLANFSRYRSRLPDRMQGFEFLSHFDGISDPTVTVNPGVHYPVRAATAHPVNEHDRVQRFASFMEKDPTVKTSAMMGELMYLSHAGYSACGLGTPATDRIVELVKEEGYKKGLFGARVTGGGSGGSVAVLASTDASDAVRDIAARYRRESGLESLVFQGSSDGLIHEPRKQD